MSEPVFTNLAKIWVDEHDITHVLFSQRREFTADDVDKYTKICMETSKGKPSLVLLDFSNINFLEMGAYKKLMSPELTRITKASAVVVSPSSNFVVAGISFIMSLNKEPYPVKVFTNEAEAMEWLLSLKKK